MSLWRTRQQPPTVPAQRPSPAQEATSEGEKARKQAQVNLAAARAKGAEVKRVSASLRSLRERNHFAAQIQHLFNGGH